MCYKLCIPRKTLKDAPGALHHVMARGIERRIIFTDNEDCDDLLERLESIAAETHTSCYAWSLVRHHFHLLLKTGCVPIATVMHQLLTGNAIRFIRRHVRTGHLVPNRTNINPLPGIPRKRKPLRQLKWLICKE